MLRGHAPAREAIRFAAEEVGTHPVRTDDLVKFVSLAAGTVTTFRATGARGRAFRRSGEAGSADSASSHRNAEPPSTRENCETPGSSPRLTSDHRTPLRNR